MLRKLFNEQRAALWYVILVICLPLTTLVALGLVLLWQNQWLLVVSMAWLAVTLAGFALYKFWPARKITIAPKASESPLADADDASLISSLPTALEPRHDWTALDKRVWSHAVLSVEQLLDKPTQWQALPDLGVQLLTRVSQYYDLENRGISPDATAVTASAPDTSYSFTLPEMLLVLSVTSSRYRQLLLSHIPFAERIKVSSLLSLYSHQDQIVKGASWLNKARRTARFVNPLAAIAAELRDQFTDRIFTNLSDKVQHDLQRLLLQELSQVAMDLYSGRLKQSAIESSGYVSQSQIQDIQDIATPAEPLRVLLIGQVSSGKSSLINALAERLDAETGILPTTDKNTVHVLNWKDDGQSGDSDMSNEAIHLIDTIGLVDDTSSVAASVAAAQQADLLIWVTRATQPARAPEAALYEALYQSFASLPDRRPPPLLLVMTHIDQLSPKAQWDPPYELTSDNRKAQSIRLALESCVRQIGLPEDTPGVPVCLADNQQTYNTDVVAAQLMMQRDDATQTQLNRRRTEQNATPVSWRERWDQASKLGTVTGKLLVKSIRGK